MKIITEHEDMICQDCQKTISSQKDLGYWGVWDIHSEGTFSDENSYKMHLCIRCYYQRVDKEEKHD